MARSASRRANKDESLGMDSFRQPREEEGLSLESIGQAFAEMLVTGDDPYSSPPDADSDPLLAAASEAVAVPTLPVETQPTSSLPSSRRRAIAMPTTRSL